MFDFVEFAQWGDTAEPMNEAQITVVPERLDRVIRRQSHIPVPSFTKGAFRASGSEYLNNKDAPEIASATITRHVN